MRDPIDVPGAPEATPGDAAHTAVSAVLSAVPLLGGPAQALFQAVIAPPIESRRDEWMDMIAAGLQRLEEKVQGFTISSLVENPHFTTAVLRGGQAAIRTHQEEKLEALRNAVLNAALPSAPADDLQTIFFELVDRFTPWHLRLLKFLDGPKDWGLSHGVEYPNWTMGGIRTAIDHTFPELRENHDFCDMIADDLANAQLSSADRRSMGVTMTGSGMFEGRTMPIGRQFLKFIEDPLDGEV